MLKKTEFLVPSLAGLFGLAGVIIAKTFEPGSEFALFVCGGFLGGFIGIILTISSSIKNKTRASWATTQDFVVRKITICLIALGLLVAIAAFLIHQIFGGNQEPLAIISAVIIIFGLATTIN